MRDAVEHKFFALPEFNIGLAFQHGRVIRSWVGHRTRRAFYQQLQQVFPKSHEAAQRSPHVQQAASLFARYSAGEDVDLSRLAHRLPQSTPALVKRLYRELKKIKPGDLITYQELADLLELPGGARAIGNWLGKNPLPMIIPCHRVVGRNHPGGFSAPGSTATKRCLLQLEGVGLDHLKPLSFFDRGVRTRDLAAEFAYREPRLREIIQRTDPFRPSATGPHGPFVGLAKGIVYQQLATAAARTIFRRLLLAQGRGSELAPSWIHHQSVVDLRQLGLSLAKIQALKSLAHAELECELLSLEEAVTLPDFMIRHRLQGLRGVGPWTIEMYLIFSLGRLNVASPGDLALGKALNRLAGPSSTSSRTRFLRTVLPWEPWRTLGSWYLWRLVENKEI